MFWYAGLKQVKREYSLTQILNFSLPKYFQGSFVNRTQNSSKNLIHYDFLLKNATDIITKCDSYFITKCDTSVIQNVTVFLQNATVIKNCNKTIIVQVKRKKEIYIPVHCRYHPITNIGFISQTQTFPRATGEGGERL